MHYTTLRFYFVLFCFGFIFVLVICFGLKVAWLCVRSFVYVCCIFPFTMYPFASDLCLKKNNSNNNNKIKLNIMIEKCVYISIWVVHEKTWIQCKISVCTITTTTPITSNNWFYSIYFTSRKYSNCFFSLTSFIYKYFAYMGHHEAWKVYHVNKNILYTHQLKLKQLNVPRTREKKLLIDKIF